MNGQGKLTGKLPVLSVWTYLLRKAVYRLVRITDLEWKVLKVHACGYSSGILILSHEELHKGGRTSAVPTCEAELPVCVYVEADMIEYHVRAPFV